ncbi:tagaturonate reductase [Fibrella sp. HMF5335]|uniref:Tagaturonate reductase n=1 Tax=Fibrella rubiginis TaxID=2817060 RepID=A0A939JZR2_9BACT|nr:tagaturonate reductase [Fibrella rubiginis]MBO0935317.1 tagaturonate reductase [Fibrella rubiginis]
MNLLSASLSRAASPATTSLPERVLQFGTGVLLRGLPDYLIQRANEQGVFNGSIVVVKSTGNDVSEFTAQDNLYTVWSRGIENGGEIDQKTVVSAISRVLAAPTQWADVLALARKPSLQVIISNTTEVGLTYVEESVFEMPPRSFPAKLTAFLYERFKSAGGSRKMGLVVIPTELLPDNGLRLRDAVERVAKHNELGKLFTKWLKFHVRFCNSLVDRIVTGRPDDETMEAFAAETGYTDELLTATEPYHLWAIEGDDRVRSILSFATISPDQVIIDEDISFYRERKLRLLNGTHTFMTPLSYLLGNVTVAEAMNHPTMGPFIEHLLLDDLVPTVPYDSLGDEGPAAVQSFAHEVIDRFKNPFNEHFLLNISLQQTAKMALRNVPTLLRAVQQQGSVPDRMAICFAAYLLFMRVHRRTEEGEFLGEINLKKGALVYPIRDEQAAYFMAQWLHVDPTKAGSVTALVTSILSNTTLWQTDLTTLPGFSKQVASNLFKMLNEGVETTLK